MGADRTHRHLGSGRAAVVRIEEHHMARARRSESRVGEAPATTVQITGSPIMTTSTSRWVTPRATTLTCTKSQMLQSG
jgi:hypothetical protein